LSKVLPEEGRGRQSQRPTKLTLGGLANTNEHGNLVQLSAKYYTVKTWKNALLCVHNDIKRMDFEFGPKMWPLPLLLYQCREKDWLITMKISSQQLNTDPFSLPVERKVNKCSQDVINESHVRRCLKSKRDILLIYSFLRFFLSAIVVFFFSTKR
jgi:hypothetical protein